MDKPSALDYINQMFPTGAKYSSSMYHSLKQSNHCSSILIIDNNEAFLLKAPSTLFWTAALCLNEKASLSGVEPLMQKIHGEIRRVDAGILAAVCQQGLKKADQQSVLDDFNKRGSGITQPPIAPRPLSQLPLLPFQLLSLPLQLQLESIASREDVLTRAAALGRGAATTGF